VTREEEDEILTKADSILRHRLRLAECDRVTLEVMRYGVVASFWRGSSRIVQRDRTGLALAATAIDDTWKVGR